MLPVPGASLDSTDKTDQVSAGIDLTLEWIRQWYSEELRDLIAIGTEVVPRAHDDDPFTDLLGIPHQGQL
jgi:hypothetical protein